MHQYRKRIAFGAIFAVVYAGQYLSGHDGWYSLGYAATAALMYGAFGVIVYRGLRTTVQGWRVGLKAWVNK